MKSQALLLVNFGGPRSLEEIPTFLKALLLDREVIRTKMPFLFHHFLFSYVAKKRAKKVKSDYELIGGKSPIFDDTEAIAKELEALTFHRYLKKTHKAFYHTIHQVDAEEILVFPLFPQFSYATTGSIALFFHKYLKRELVQKMRWLPSYETHPLYIKSMVETLQHFLQEKGLDEKRVHLLFSAHGLPQTFVDEGDPYYQQCLDSFEAIGRFFPHASKELAFQSKFGKGEWLRPYTEEVCKQATKDTIIIPLSFTSDHIETLYEIEHQYLPLLRQQNVHAYRLPALNLNPSWILSIKQMFQEATVPNDYLLRKNPFKSIKTEDAHRGTRGNGYHP